MLVGLIPRAIKYFYLSEYGTMHFILPEAKQLYMYFRKSTKFKMLDNGAYETEALDDDELINLAHYVDADEVVAPDIMFKGKESYERTKTFVETQSTNRRICVVPQGKDPKEFIQYYIKLAKLEVDTIAFPIWLEKKFRARTRTYYRLRELGRIDESKSHHLIGLDDFTELTRYGKGDFRSVDTSLPFTMAHHRVEKPFKEMSRIPKDVEYDAFQYNLAKMLIDDLMDTAKDR